MVKVAVLVYTDTDTLEDMGRVMNALETAKEFKENGDEIRLIFDGAGTQWIPELEAESHRLHQLYRTVKDDIQVCDYCADEFHVADVVADHGVEILAEYDGHPSIRSLVLEGYEVITI